MLDVWRREEWSDPSSTSAKNRPGPPGFMWRLDFLDSYGVTLVTTAAWSLPRFRSYVFWEIKPIGRRILTQRKERHVLSLVASPMERAPRENLRLPHRARARPRAPGPAAPTGKPACRGGVGPAGAPPIALQRLTPRSVTGLEGVGGGELHCMGGGGQERATRWLTQGPVCPLSSAFSPAEAEHLTPQGE